MAIIKKEGGIVEKQPTLAEAAQAQGQNTPISPTGAAALQGTTAKQQDMAGTPAQTEARLRSVVREQAPKTLSQAERYAKQAEPSTAAQEAKDKAETLRQLGPVQGRIQSLIEQRIQGAQAQTAALGVNQEALQGIQNVDQRQAAEAAFTQYLQSPTEANLQQIYDTVGSSALEDIAIYFQGAPEAIKQAIAPQIVGKATLAELSLDQLGTSLTDLSNVLGVDAQTLEGMTLNQLNEEIDALQAEELNQTEQLTATLYSPSASPQQKKAAIDQLKQLGVAGIPGTEQAIEMVQDQIANAQTIEVAGREMTLEEALSDEGLSSLISQASYDDNVLNLLKQDPKYAGIADWVSQNKEALMSLATEYEGEAQDFLGIQDEYRQARTSLGEGGDELLSTILGGEIADSVLSSEWQNIQGQLETSDLYSAVLDDEMLREDLKASPQIAKEMIDNGLTREEIDEAVRIKEATEADDYVSSLLDSEGYPTTKEGIQDLKDKLDRLSSLSPNVVDMGRKYGDEISLDILEDIDASDNPEDIFADIEENRAVGRQLSRIEDRGSALDEFFGSSDFSANDLNWAIKTAPKETVDNILAIFDADGDGKVSQAETQSPDIVPKLKELLGADMDIEDIVAQDGEYDPAGIAERLMGINVNKDTFERAVSSQIDNNILERERGLEQEINTLSSDITKRKENPSYLDAVGLRSDPEYASSLFTSSIERIKSDPALKELTFLPDFTKYNPSDRYQMQSFYANKSKLQSAMDDAKKRYGALYFKTGPYIAMKEMMDMMNKFDGFFKVSRDEASANKKIAQLQEQQGTLKNQRESVRGMNEMQLSDLASLLGIM